MITVGAVDDQGTKTTGDDSLAPWSSRGITQDGFAKPDVVAPGAHIVAPLAPDSDFASLCPGCVVDERYFRIGGTSMAAPIVAGIAADMISVHPELDARPGQGRADVQPAAARRTAAWEVAADSAIDASKRELESNQGLAPSWFLDPETGAIDYTRASWRRASWRAAVDGLRASWRAASWTCDCSGSEADPTRASWGRASWRSFFGESPSDYGELDGGAGGAAGRGGGKQPR